MSNDGNNRMKDFSREIYVEINNNGLITLISENCSNLLGYSRQDLINKNIRDILTFTPQKCISVVNMKSSVITKEGAVMPVDLAGSPLFNNVNNIIGYRLSFYIHT